MNDFWSIHEELFMVLLQIPHLNYVRITVNCYQIDSF